MPDIEFPTSSGTAPGYLALPAGGARPGDDRPAGVVGHGRQHPRDLRPLRRGGLLRARAGPVPRRERRPSRARPSRRLMALSMSEAEQDMCGAADYLQLQPGFEGNGVGSVGFCLGGGLSVWAAATCPNITAAVTYYYVMPHGKPDFAEHQRPGARALRHRATTSSRREDAAGARGASCARPASRSTFHYYEGAGHAFVNDTDRLGTYDEALASSPGSARVELPARRARRLSAARSIARRELGESGRRAARRARRSCSPPWRSALALAPAASAAGLWSAPAQLSACSANSPPQVLFPSDSPSHAHRAPARSCGRAAPAARAAKARGSQRSRRPTCPVAAGARRRRPRGRARAARSARPRRGPHGQIVIAGAVRARRRGAAPRRASPARPLRALGGGHGADGPAGARDRLPRRRRARRGRRRRTARGCALASSATSRTPTAPWRPLAPAGRGQRADARARLPHATRSPCGQQAGALYARDLPASGARRAAQRLGRARARAARSRRCSATTTARSWSGANSGRRRTRVYLD